MASSLHDFSAMPAELSGQQLDGHQLVNESEAAPISVSNGRFHRCSIEES